MVGLLDIAPSTRTVPVDGANVSVYGVSAHGIAYLINRFPELRTMLGGVDLGKVSAETLIKVVPDAIAAIIAAGCGYPNNEKAEAAAAKLSADAQLDLLAAIVELTMPKGAGPFFDKLNSAMRALDVSVKDPATQSPSQLSS